MLWERETLENATGNTAGDLGVGGGRRRSSTTEEDGGEGHPRVRLGLPHSLTPSSCVPSCCTTAREGSWGTTGAGASSAAGHTSEKGSRRAPEGTASRTRWGQVQGPSEVSDLGEVQVLGSQWGGVGPRARRHELCWPPLKLAFLNSG